MVWASSFATLRQTFPPHLGRMLGLRTNTALKFIAYVVASAISVLSHAAETSPPFPSSITNAPPQALPEMVVHGHDDRLIGVADSANQGTIDAAQLASRPMLRSGEILESVPGVIITQHSGGGKANQYFLRGFNLDHGTDFATSLDGMPLNLPTHAHGQGYTDMNLVIPELVETVDYQKGVYSAENGDFASAGAAHVKMFRVLSQSLAILEGGTYGYGRALFAASPKMGEGHLLYGFEAYHDDGPWQKPDDYQKFNGILTYSHGDEQLGYSITARAYHGQWNSSDQVADSAVQRGLVPFFGSLDDTTGGQSQRYSLQAEWHHHQDQSATKVMAYGFYYDLDLFSNFTYFLTDTNRGDQFEQQDKRITTGLQADHAVFGLWGKKEVETTFGLQFRNDNIRNGLYQTQDQRRVDKTDSATGNPLPSTIRQDDIFQNSVGLFVQNRIQWADKFRSVAGVRGDVYQFDVHSHRDLNSGDRVDAVGSPKLSLIFGPWSQTEVYVQGGMGFHSNDGRGVNTRVDPVTGLRVDSDGNPIQRADPLVRTYGAEIGVRSLALDHLQSTVSFWWLDVDSELVFVGDAGATEASRPSRRYGVEWANNYPLTRHLTLDADVSFSHAAFRNHAIEGDHIPGSIESVVAAGLSYRDERGLFGSLRLRYFGSRPLTEDNRLRSEATVSLNAQLGYHFSKTWTFTAEILNVLDRRDHDIDYAYESRVLPNDAVPSGPTLHFHPVEPIQARFALTARF